MKTLLLVTLLLASVTANAKSLSNADLKKADAIVWNNADAYDFDSYKEQGFKAYICDIGTDNATLLSLCNKIK